MLGSAVLGLSLWALLHLRTGAPLCLSRQLKMKGDYMLGGLFPLGEAGEAAFHSRTRPSSLVCTRFSWNGLLWALAMKMAVEEINNQSDLLPGLRLGYDLFDTCSESVVTMKPSLMFLAKVNSHDIAAYCNYTQYQPRVLAVIGPHSSELALVTGKFFGFFLMPQVSYGASMDLLSTRETFPSFFRTVPSDRVQLMATVELLQQLGWNWVAALGSDDEYGRQGLSIFSGLAAARGICIAHEGLVPLPRADGLWVGKVQELLPQVNQSSIQVVLLFASAHAAHAFFRHSINRRLLPKVWVASEAWLTSDLVMGLPGMAEVGTVLGFLQRGAQLPKFPQYVKTHLALAADPAFCASLSEREQGLEEHVVGPRCPQCDDVTLQNMSTRLQHHQTFSVYAAVYSVAQALHNTLRCNASGCPKQDPVKPWQLLQNMYNMTFHAAGLALRFDSSGNVDVEYDLKLWVWRGPVPELHDVGVFNGSLWPERLKMRWHTPDNQEPVSQCSRQCQEGQVRRVKGFHSCCYDCVDCEAGSYRRNPDDPTCTPCRHDQWSPERSTRCFRRRPRFLTWSEPAVLLLLLLLGLALGLVLAALGLFIHHRDSPLVQASGGGLACFGLVCLGLVCLSVLLFPGQPSPARCLAQQPLSHLPLTGCLSTLFLQAAETFVESELPQSWADRVRGCLRGSRAWLAVLLAMLVEAALCAWYLLAFPPEVVTDWRVLPTEALVHCCTRSWVSFGLVHATNAILAFLSFLGTFLVQSQPGRYNRARGLTFAMLAYFITWVSFVPLLANVQVALRPAMQMGAFLLCTLGILAAFHLPRCYLLLWQPGLNTPEFFLGGARMPNAGMAVGTEEAQGKIE
ncbi:taste receptor type 1 member 3 isoform X1 [Callithrix jacchus]|uniref:Taste receptor type 1 member 3 n=2 Tax=Callithrix jacchus TaxID=9483 RepID=F7H1F6_CALJA|nr:taste receptor type 1 member 3 isoform X1 [Callithrix jacchus]BCT43488.1 taste 1 receptor member 3 [Callithrix jacchus]